MSYVRDNKSYVGDKKLKGANTDFPLLELMRFRRKHLCNKEE